MFTFCDLDQKYSFWAKLVLKIKTAPKIVGWEKLV